MSRWVQRLRSMSGGSEERERPNRQVHAALMGYSTKLHRLKKLNDREEELSKRSHQLLTLKLQLLEAETSLEQVRLIKP